MTYNELSFNSSMVRLEEYSESRYEQSLDSFNSSMVRLEAGNHSLYLDVVSSFNSSMVRLEVPGKHLDPARTVFQFQYGSIRRVSQ